jgi:hypothetical protein
MRIVSVENELLLSLRSATLRLPVFAMIIDKPLIDRDQILLEERMRTEATACLKELLVLLKPDECLGQPRREDQTVIIPIRKRLPPPQTPSTSAPR